MRRNVTLDEKEEDFNVLNQCRVKYDVLDHWYAWKPSYLETEEELTEIKDKTTRKKQEIRLRGDYAVNFFQQHLEGKNFIKLGNTFVKLADDSFAVLMEVDAEFDDISLYYGVIPMCMNFDPDIEFGLQFSIDLCDMREKTDEKCLEVFYENIFSKLIELESLTDVWNFLWKEYDEEYHENAKGRLLK